MADIGDTSWRQCAAVIEKFKDMDRGDWCAAIGIPIIVCIIGWSFCVVVGREHAAQALCTEVDGRDYEGCVHQQYHILRAEYNK